MYIIFVTVYSFGAFRSIIAADLVSSFQLADDSPQKIEQMKQAAEEILNQVMYRYSLVEPARLKAIEKKDAFKSVTKTDFTQTKPREGKEAQKLWKEAKTAADKYATGKNRVAPTFNLFVIQVHGCPPKPKWHFIFLNCPKNQIEIFNGKCP